MLSATPRSLRWLPPPSSPAALVAAPLPYAWGDEAQCADTSDDDRALLDQVFAFSLTGVLPTALKELSELSEVYCANSQTTGLRKGQICLWPTGMEPPIGIEPMT